VHFRKKSVIFARNCPHPYLSDYESGYGFDGRKTIEKQKFPVRKESMKNVKLRVLLSLVSLFSIMMAASNSAFAAPVRFEQIQQVINVKPGRANTGGFAQLRLANDGVLNVDGDDDDDKTNTPPKTQDDRVIVTTTTTMEEDDACNCPVERERKGFPKWAFLGLAAIPLLFLIGRDKTPTRTPTETPTTTPMMTPTMTPTVTPTPEPVPEPMTILLFGTGLAGIGLAARRRLRKREADADGSDEQGEE
jgi:hypothetical protein